MTPELAPEANLTQAVLPHDTFWAIEEAQGLAYWNAIKAQTVGVHIALYKAEQAEAEARSRTASETDSKPFAFDPVDGLAMFSISGPMTKKTSSLSSGTSTVRLRREVRAALADPEVKGGFLVIESPGGSVAGTAELADDVAAFAIQKPLFAFVDDTGASAAYWVASQATRIYANRQALVGSIGTLMVLADMSRYAKNLGVEVLVFGSGGFKGAGTPGAEVTPEQKAYFQSLVDSLNANFLAAVQAGRGFSAEQLAAVTDARVHIAADALALGLIDAVGTLDEALSALQAATKASGKGSRSMGFRAAVTALIAAFAGQTLTAEDKAAMDKVQQVAEGEPDANQTTPMPAADATPAPPREEPAADTNYAEIGKQHLTAERDRVAKLAVVALGAEEGAQAAATVQTLPLAAVSALGTEYERVAKAKGLMGQDGTAPGRTTAAAALAQIAPHAGGDLNAQPKASADPLALDAIYAQWQPGAHKNDRN